MVPVFSNPFQMSSLVKFLKGKKAYIVSGLLVLVALVNLLTGDIYWSELLADPNLIILLNGLGVGSLRAALK